MTDDRAAIDQEDTRPETPPAEPEVSTREKRFEVIATFLLAFAALATAWTGYQASLWDGIQSSNYTQASAARTGAAQLRTEANQFRLADLSVFESFVDASVGGNDELAEFCRDRFRPEFEVAFDAWIALDPFDDPDAPPSPLAMAEYRLAADAEAATLDARADTLFRTLTPSSCNDPGLSRQRCFRDSPHRNQLDNKEASHSVTIGEAVAVIMRA